MASLVFLILSAICVQSLSLLLQTKQYSYHSHPHYHGALYALGTLAAFHIAPQALHHPALQWSNPLALLWLSLTLATLAFNRYVPISLGYRLRHKKSYFLDFNLAFVLVKIGDIFFQQSFLVAFILILFGHFPHVSTVVIITLITFVAAHLPLLWIQRKVSVLHLIGAALFIGIVPLAILQVQGGFWLIWFGHWCFYITIRLLMGIKPLRRSVLGQDLEFDTQR